MTIEYPDKRVVRTKEKFKSTLLFLMEKKNFHDITITEIVNTAGFNRGTFYLHYSQKEDLLDEIIEEVFNKLIKAFRKPYSHLSVLDFNYLTADSVVIFNHFFDHQSFYKLMLNPKTNYNFAEKLIKQLETLFKKDFNYLQCTGDNALDINLFSTYRIYGISGLIIEWIENDFNHSPSYMADQLIRIVKSFTSVVHVNSK